MVFLGQQLLSAYGVPFAAAGLTLDALPLVDGSSPTRFYHWALAETPYHPIQILLGFVVGWRTFRWLGLRCMFWTCVLPLLLLCYALAAVPTFTPTLTRAPYNRVLANRLCRTTSVGAVVPRTDA